MKDTLSIPLLDTSKTDEIIEFFKSSRVTKKMIISTNAKDHKGITKYPNGLYISYGYLTLSQSFFLFSFVKMISNLFGEYKLNPKNQEMCKYYRQNEETALLVELEDDETPTEKFMMYKNKIVSKAEVANLCENSNDRHQDIEYCKFITKYNLDPRKSETNFFTRFILNYFTEQQELVEIYKSIQDFKKEHEK